MIRQLICRLKKGERGAALIEFALAILILPVLVIGIIEFGWILTGYITVTGAAREGARVAVVGGDYEQAVYNHTASMPALSVTQTILTGDKGAKTTVTVTGSLNTFTKFFDFLGDGTYSFTSAATMRQEKFIIGSPPGGGEPEEPDAPVLNPFSGAGSNSNLTLYFDRSVATVNVIGASASVTINGDMVYLVFDPVVSNNTTITIEVKSSDEGSANTFQLGYRNATQKWRSID